MSVFYDFGQGTGGANLENWLAPNYDPSVEWKKGQYCVYLGVLKQCLAPTTGTFDESKWEDDFLINKSGGGSGSDSFEFIAKEYDPADTHDKGEIALYSDETYECLEDGVTGAWDASKWKRTYLAYANQNLGGLSNISDCTLYSTQSHIKLNTKNYNSLKITPLYSWSNRTINIHANDDSGVIIQSIDHSSTSTSLIDVSSYESIAITTNSSGTKISFIYELF